MGKLNEIWRKASGLNWDIESMIANASSDDQKEQLFNKLNWHIGLLKSSGTSIGKYDDSANGESDLLDEIRAALGEEIAASVQELLDAIADGGEVELKEAIEVPEIVQIASDATIDLNSKGISISKPNANNKCVLFYVNGEGSKLTVKGEGEVAVNGNSNADIAIWAQSGAEVTIESGDFKSKGRGDLIYAFTGGKIIINGGTFEKETTDDTSFSIPQYNILNVYNGTVETAKDQLIVTGGKFKNFNPANNVSEGVGTSFVADGYTVMVDGVENLDPWTIGMPDMWYEVVEKPEPEIGAGGEMEEGEEN